MNLYLRSSPGLLSNPPEVATHPGRTTVEAVQPSV
jgi:hypothetical protein